MGRPTPIEALLSISLAAIAANWRLLRDRHPGGAVAAVVKADAYGLGAARIGPALRDAGCRHFFVAHLAEGVALRAAIGPESVIAVLNGFAPGADGGAALLPVLNGLGDVEAHAAAARRRGRAAPAILHFDTGMNRLGLDRREQETVAAEPSHLHGLGLRWLMTHLACADEPAHSLNTAQAARFAAICARLPVAVPRSIANSSGMFLGPAFTSDLARPGCALYGINPTPGRPNPMRQVVQLDAPILQAREIAPGDTVGYGATWTAERLSRVATVAAGYADGYLRALSGRAFGILAGQSVPLIGRVSMDLIAFDVTDTPPAALAPGATIRLIGPENTPDDLAARAGTISYEILTALGNRYRREYRAD